LDVSEPPSSSSEEPSASSEKTVYALPVLSFDRSDSSSDDDEDTSEMYESADELP